MISLGRISVLLGVLALPLSQPANAWKIAQTFDDVAEGASCGWDSGGGSKVSSTQAFSGSKGCRLSINQGDTAFGTWGGVLLHPSNVGRGGEIWFRVRTYMPAGFNYDSSGEGNHLKFLRIHTRSASSENYGYDDIYINPKGRNPPFKFIYEGEQVWGLIGSLTGTLTSILTGTVTTQPIMLGTWETYELYVKLDTVPASKGGMATVRFWKNGVLLSEMRDRITLKTADAYADRTHLFTYWNGASPATQQMYVDDVVLTNETPATKDAAGNPYIGAGVAQTAPKPQAPGGISVQ